MYDTQHVIVIRANVEAANELKCNVHDWASLALFWAHTKVGIDPLSILMSDHDPVVMVPSAQLLHYIRKWVSDLQKVPASKDALRGKVFFLFPYLALTLVSPLDGVARNYFSYFYLPEYARCTQFIMSGSIYSYLLCPRREEKKPLGLSWNQPRSSCFNYPQVTALTTWPCLLGHLRGKVTMSRT